MSLQSEVIRILNAWLANAKKISQLTALPSPVTTGDLLEVVRGGQNYKADGSQLPSGGGGGTWGSITGTLSAQTDLQAALDLKESLYRTFDRKTGDYPLVLADSTKGIEMNVGSANTVTVPLNATQAFPIGTLIPVVQYGAGLTSIVATGGVTINASAGNLDSPGQYAPMFLRKIATNEWYLWNGTVAGGGSSAWGGITGTITDQTDLVTYVAAQVGAAVAGLLDLRGTFDASGGAYPSSGGSGTAGAILKADTWIISVAGTLPTGQAVQAGDLIFAIIDTPGNTQANWGRIENNLTYVPVNRAGDTMSGNLAMGTNKVTGLAAASGNGEALRYEQLVGAYLLLTGGALSGALAMGTNKVTGLAAATAAGDALRYEQLIGIQDLFVSAAAMWARTTNGCSALTQTEMATSLFNIQSLDFDQTTQEFAQFQVVLPRKFNNGTVTVVVYWTAASGSGDVQWGISGGAYSNDDALTVALGTAITVDDTLITANDLHITSATSAITLAGTPADADFLAFQISRNPASDTLTADAKLLGISIRVTTDAGVDA